MIWHIEKFPQFLIAILAGMKTKIVKVKGASGHFLGQQTFHLAIYGDPGGI